MTNTKQLLSSLEEAIKNQDKRSILHLYDEFGMVEWEIESKDTCDKYDKLVDIANDILYED